MLSLPLPLRPEHRLTQLVTAANAIPLTCSHLFVQQLTSSIATKPSWLLSSVAPPPPPTTSAGNSGPPPSVNFTTLPPHLRKQLVTWDEEAQRLYWLYEFFTNSTAGGGIQYCTQVQTAMNLASRTPPPPPPPPPTTALPLASKLTNTMGASGKRMSLTNGPPSSRCPLIFIRILLVCRLPDHLLRLLKWLVQSQTELMEQRRLKENDTNGKVCLAQIDRIKAQCAFMEEMCWKLLWRMEQIIKSGQPSQLIRRIRRVLSTCCCKLPENVENLFSPWWNHDCMIKSIRVIASFEPLSEMSIYSFIDLMLGDSSLFSLQSLTSPSTRKHRTLKIALIREMDMLQNFLFALANTSDGLTHEGLEFLSMMLLRLPDNGQIILRHGGWQSGLVPLMLNGGIEDTIDFRSRAIATKTLQEILKKEMNKTGSLERRGSAIGSNSKDTLTPEAMLATNIKLSLNIWVLMHFTHFLSSSESDESLCQRLNQSFDAIEDHMGWLSHTILLVRVLLVSLLTKINSSPHKRIFRNDIHHPSWACLFDVLTVCENFIFYSPLTQGRNLEPDIFDKTATKNTTATKRAAGVGPASRRTNSVLQGGEKPTSTESPHLARPKESRRFKVVGIHVSALGVCEDEIIVQKILELLESLKFNELDSNLDATAELVDRDRLKKLKKQGLCDIEFFEATAAYFRQCSSKRRQSQETSTTANVVRSVPELLEKRRHQRSLSGGRLSGMFQNFTRSKRLRSMEQKLNGFVMEAADQRRPSLTSVVDRSSTGRYFNLVTRLKHSRAGGPGHDGIHQKLNLELVKLKIESHYLPQQRRLPPPIPSNRPPSSRFQKATNQEDFSSPEPSSDSPPPPVPPYSPEMARKICHPRTTSKGIPITSLVHLMNRPLPGVPPIIPDRQQVGAIVLSPTHGDRHTFEPKEGEGDDGLIHDIKEEDADEVAAETDYRCSHCQIMTPEEETWWNCNQTYCHTCFKTVFCCCSQCGLLIEDGQSYARLTGLEDTPMIRTAIANEAEIEEFYSQVTDEDAETMMYHTSCLTCCACDTLPPRSDSMDELLPMVSSQWYEKEGRIYCSQDYARLYGESCAQCRQIITGECVHALKKSWHPDCFVCAGECGRELTEGKYYLAPEELISPPMSPKTTTAGDTGRPGALSPLPGVRANRSAYCEACFNTLFQFCHFCSEPINADEKGILVKHLQGKRPYHARCYQCVICLKVNAADDKLYAGDDDDCLYCYQHYVWKFFTKCGSCGDSIVDEERGGYVTVNSVDYHADCVNCYVCKKTLRGEFEKVYTKICEDGTRVTNERGEESTCKQILLCDAHRTYDPTPAPSCTICTKPIRSDVKTIAKSSYHSSCLKCVTCQSPLDPANPASLHPDPSNPTTTFYCASHPPSIVQTTCPQCQKSLSKGARVELSHGLQYHSGCLYCTTCRVPIPKGGQLSAFEILPTTNKIYCVKHIPA